MVRKLFKNGGSWALLLPKLLLELAKINPEKDCVEINVSYGKIIIEKSQNRASKSESNAA